MVSAEVRVFGRPGDRQALNRACQSLDLVPKGRDEIGICLSLAGQASSIGTEEDRS
jgi:hypothetical protein